MMVDLDKMYREEGWGLLTDKALGISPSNVESQARSVAQHAYEIITPIFARVAQLEEALGQVRDDYRSDLAEAEAAAIVTSSIEAYPKRVMRRVHLDTIRHRLDAVTDALSEKEARG